jgi:peptide/nickel transport system substrate-binding protein
MQRWLWSAAFALALALVAGPVTAKTFRWASDGDVRSLDPYAGQEIFLRGFDGNIYEPLVRHDRTDALEPALAVRWVATAPELWRFTLRDNVVFQDGTPLDADDVVFSFMRARTPQSKIAGLLAAVREVRRIDAHTVEFATRWPDPILPDELSAWPIMSRAWCAAHDAATPTDLAGGEPSYAADHANGTGPFMVAERVPDERTILLANPFWWDKPEHNLDRVVFTPLADASNLTAGLEAGALDMIYTVPAQDLDRIARTPGLRIIEGPGLTTVFLGFDQRPGALPESSVKGRNPFADRRVRQAFAHAIDEQAIIDKVMRGHATPTALLVAPGVTGFDAALDRRAPYDPVEARRLLAEAGFPTGFETGLDCPTDRYVNDEAICEEVVAMLAKIGITVRLHAQGRADYFAKIMSPKAPSSFFLLGRMPATDDALSVLIDLAATRNGSTHAGEFNVAGYSNPALDTLIARAQGESDRPARLALLRQALALVRDDVAYLPLHQQDVVWAVRDGVELVQRADDIFPLRFVRIK